MISQAAFPRFAPTPAGVASNGKSLKRLIEVVGLLKSVRGLTSRQEDAFSLVIASARSAVESGDEMAIAAASRALDILSLELCEE